MSAINSPDALIPSQIADLQQRAVEAAKNAYAPYSSFRVGAALLLEDGAIVTGCNVENASYRLTTCAEQTAITSAVALHGPGIRIRAIAVANLNNAASQPCGACRQTILEFSTPNTVIFFPKHDGTFDKATIADLLPAAFVLINKMTHHIHPIDVILHKRDGLALSDAEIRTFIHAVVDRTPTRLLVTDAQIGAFLMAVFLNGLDPRELATLTTAMRYSGEVFYAEFLNTFTIDKHSTGGVGDKTSLLIAPILAAAGLAHPNSDGVPGICVPMISGRSLGHTGGTLDKLETIPGFNTQLSLPDMRDVITKCGAALIGQTPNIVPADRILYALRDHTGTVESPFLITASIMSKKLAEDLKALVLDVKVGSGAFMPTYEKSKFLAELMVRTGEASGTRTTALLTTMDEPLGRFSGNWIEVWECVDIMKQHRHPMSADLIELSNVLSGWMLHLAGHAATPEAGAKLANEILTSGAAYKSWLKIITAQGGDTSIFEDPAAFHKPKATRTLTVESSGYLAAMDCKQVGWAVQRLGAGRAKPGDPVSAHGGIEMHAKLGSKLEKGQPLATLFAEDASLLKEPEAMLRETLQIASAPPKLQPLIREVITTNS